MGEAWSGAGKGGDGSLKIQDREPNDVARRNL